MKRWMTVAVLVAAVSAFVVALVGAAATPGPASVQAATANRVIYKDATGEDPLSPDITTVTVSNDDAGTITFQIALPGTPTLAADHEVALFLDADKNSGTGADADGSDYVIDLRVVPGTGHFEVVLGRWDANTLDFDFATPQQTLRASYSAGATFVVNTSELGGTTAFDFTAVAGTGINALTGEYYGHHDVAPNDGRWSYQLTANRFVLSVARFFTVPAQPRAGRRFLATLVVASPEALPVTPQVTCKVTIAGKALALKSKAFVDGAATCGWQVPKSAKGKLMNGSVTVVVQGVRVSPSFSAKVR